MWDQWEYTWSITDEFIALLNRSINDFIAWLYRSIYDEFIAWLDRSINDEFIVSLDRLINDFIAWLDRSINEEFIAWLDRSIVKEFTMEKIWVCLKKMKINELEAEKHRGIINHLLAWYERLDARPGYESVSLQSQAA